MDELIDAARGAAATAYAPYSEYRVGAALRVESGPVVTGCNVENVNYSNSLHAEEIAIATAIVRGHRSFGRLAVSSTRRDGVTPCGMCRQTLAEFCQDDFPIVCDAGASTTTYTLGELLPVAMTADTIGEGRHGT